MQKVLDSSTASKISVGIWHASDVTSRRQEVPFVKVTETTFPELVTPFSNSTDFDNRTSETCSNLRIFPILFQDSGGCTPVLFAVGCATPPGSRPDHRQPHSRERSSSSHPPLANVPKPLGRPTPPPFVSHPRHSMDPDIVWRLTDPQRTNPRHPTQLSEWGHRLPGPNWWKERQRRETVNLSLYQSVLRQTAPSP